MNTHTFLAKKVSSPLQWFRIYRLYRRAFPRNERKPFHIIVSMWRKGKTDVWYFESNRRFAGFASTINAADLILLDYLAVKDGLRGRGFGSRILGQLKQHYCGKGIFVEIESACKPAPNQAERIRRRRFYMANGMQPAQVMASVFGVNMELLCWNCRVDFCSYHAFYRDNYSAWAAQHIVKAEYPPQAQLP